MQVKCSVDLQCDLIKKVLGVAKGLIPNDSLKSYLVRESFLLVIGRLGKTHKIITRASTFKCFIYQKSQSNG